MKELYPFFSKILKMPLMGVKGGGYRIHIKELAEDQQLNEE